MNKETKLRAPPAAITLTTSAQDRIAELMARAPEGAVGVKLSTPRRGCSGLAYSVDYVTEENPLDEKIVTPGGTFYVDQGVGGTHTYAVSAVNLAGAESAKSTAVSTANASIAWK